jgi:hypothetical protein
LYRNSIEHFLKFSAVAVVTTMMMMILIAAVLVIATVLVMAAVLVMVMPGDSVGQDVQTQGGGNH